MSAPRYHLTASFATPLQQSVCFKKTYDQVTASDKGVKLGVLLLERFGFCDSEMKAGPRYTYFSARTIMTVNSLAFLFSDNTRNSGRYNTPGQFVSAGEVNIYNIILLFYLTYRNLLINYASVITALRRASRALALTTQVNSLSLTVPRPRVSYQHDMRNGMLCSCGLMLCLDIILHQRQIYVYCLISCLYANGGRKCRPDTSLSLSEGGLCS